MRPWHWSHWHVLQAGHVCSTLQKVVWTVRPLLETKAMHNIVFTFIVVLMYKGLVGLHVLPAHVYFCIKWNENVNNLKLSFTEVTDLSYKVYF